MLALCSLLYVIIEYFLWLHSLILSGEFFQWFLQIINLTHISFFLYVLFQFYTCFEHPCAHHQENQLYQYDIWYMSLYVCDRPVCRPAYQTVTYIEWHILDVVLIQLFLLMMSTWVLETCRELEWTYTKKELCVKLVICKNYTEKHDQQNIKFFHWYRLYLLRYRLMSTW